MVAHMQAMISAVKQSEHSPSRKRPADQYPPHSYAGWALLKPDMPSCTKADVGRPGTCDILIPSPDDTSNSWETRAFAEDASSLAAGIWPPRAYPCSFCHREFRSAQALGGHMNVHRRDRARLRHSSPPSSPFCAPTYTPDQPGSLFQSQKYGVNHSAQSPREPLIMLNTSPISVSMSSIPPATHTTPCTSVSPSSYPSNFSTSFPLRLQQLASQAASSLMQLPQPYGSADLLSLWQTSMTNSAKFACHSNMHAPPLKRDQNSMLLSSPTSSMVSSARPSPTTTSEVIPACRRYAPVIGPDQDESPPLKKKSHTGSSLYCSQKSRNSSQTENTQISVVKIDVEDTICSDLSREVHSDVDLELRLGQRPPW